MLGRIIKAVDSTRLSMLIQQDGWGKKIISYHREQDISGLVQECGNPNLVPSHQYCSDCFALTCQVNTAGMANDNAPVSLNKTHD